ncbi:MAG TPA: hypothetical protein VGM17_15020 [Rhizomicrobium sp.]|jgi:hypothetical protein
MRRSSLVSAAAVLIALTVAGCNQSSNKNHTANTPAMTTGAKETRGGFRAACREDIRQYCASQRGRERRECLETHKSQLSESCRALLDSRGAGRVRRRRSF